MCLIAISDVDLFKMLSHLIVFPRIATVLDVLYLCVGGIVCTVALKIMIESDDDAERNE